MEKHDIENILLNKSCGTQEVTLVIIDQINSLNLDIKELEVFRNELKDLFPKDQKAYRNTYIIENKVKTFTGFYMTILSYKRELNILLLKLRILLTGGGSVEEFKTALRAVMAERNSIREKTNDNKERIAELLQEVPSLMPAKI